MPPGTRRAGAGHQTLLVTPEDQLLKAAKRLLQLFETCKSLGDLQACAEAVTDLTNSARPLFQPDDGKSGNNKQIRISCYNLQDNVPRHAAVIG